MTDLNQIARVIAEKLSLETKYVSAVLKLTEEGDTLPFISRYRKEMTGNMPDTMIEKVIDMLSQIRAVDERRETIAFAIEDQNKMTDDIRRRLNAAETINELEDIYLPYKKKRNTKAQTARENGLEPLALMIMKGNVSDLIFSAEKFVKGNVKSVEDAIEGAKHIIIETISEDTRVRKSLRREFRRATVIRSKIARGKKDENDTYKDYHDMERPLRNCKAHVILALLRGKRDGVLSINARPDNDKALADAHKIYDCGRGDVRKVMEESVETAYKDYVMPSIENEVMAQAKENADDVSIEVFANNLRSVLLASPLGEKTVMAIDPGVRTGCKMAVLDKGGKLLEYRVINFDRSSDVMAAVEIAKRRKVEAIAIGDGTGSREAETAIRKLFEKDNIEIHIVSESGASIYSVSDVAREEFPDKDPTVRSAVSIGRRLQDPLSELVKIDPKSIGVGQYQHDVDQKKLKEQLDRTVVNAVNKVGVNLNTASQYLLTYVAGLNSTVAKNIVEYRDKNGLFGSREDLRKVPRLGDKTYKQCAGFLRIRGGKQPLDNTGVHPESYGIVEKMAKDMKVSVETLIKDKSVRDKIDINNYISGSVGIPTLTDIMKDLAEPGRDVRGKIEKFEFDKNVNEVSDLMVGMELPGKVTNVTAFGAFVNIGVHKDGLLHVSEMGGDRRTEATSLMSPGQRLKVVVKSIDTKNNRIALGLVEKF